VSPRSRTAPSCHAAGAHVVTVLISTRRDDGETTATRPGATTRSSAALRRQDRLPPIAIGLCKLPCLRSPDRLRRPDAAGPSVGSLGDPRGDPTGSDMPIVRCPSTRWSSRTSAQRPTSSSPGHGRSVD
jgi:hypothetical protein